MSNKEQHDVLPWKMRSNRKKNHDKLVDYILLAEFDINTGSTLRHQYPSKIHGYNDDWFAELMLPEGAHNRSVDYTYIFLNRDAPHIDQHLWTNPLNHHHHDKEHKTTSHNNNHNSNSNNNNNDNIKHVNNDDNSNVENNNDSNSRRLLYGINLVKARYDSTVRRGAIVKAMCIFSRYQFVDMLKKPLELALEDYFNNPSIDVLARLYRCIIDVSLINIPRPSLLEQCLMRRAVTFEAIGYDDKAPAYVSNTWYTVVDCKYNNCNNYQANNNQDNNNQDNIKSDSITVIPLRIPLYRTPDEVGDIYLTSLIKTFGESVMKIFHAIMMKQRVLFVGYNHAADEVAQYVLSSVAMVAPPMVNIIRRTFPYSNLSDLSFLEVPGYIAGVTNPMFKQYDKWWDLLCVLDLPNGTGTIYSADEKRKTDESKSSSSLTSSSSSANINSIGTVAIPNTISDSTSATTSTTTTTTSGLSSPMTNTTHHQMTNRNRSSSSSSSSSSISGVGYDDNIHVNIDNKFIKGVISGINALINDDWVRQQFYDYTSSIIQIAQDQEQCIVVTYDNDLTTTTTATRVVHDNNNRSINQSIYNYNSESKKGNLTLRKFMEANSVRIKMLRKFSEFFDLSEHPWIWSIHDDEDEDNDDDDDDDDENNNNNSLDDADADADVDDAIKVIDGNNNATLSSSSSPSSLCEIAENNNVVTVIDTDDNNNDTGGIDESLKTKSNKTKSSVLTVTRTKNNSNNKMKSPVNSIEINNEIGLVLRIMIRKLLLLSSTSTIEIQYNFEYLEKYLQHEYSLQGLLMMIPESKGGLITIATGLFHKNPFIRYYILCILYRIQMYESTKSSYDNLHGFLKSAYCRQYDKYKNGKLQQEMYDIDKNLTYSMTFQQMDPINHHSSCSRSSAQSGNNRKDSMSILLSSSSLSIPPILSTSSSLDTNIASLTNLLADTTNSIIMNTNSLIQSTITLISNDVSSSSNDNSDIDNIDDDNRDNAITTNLHHHHQQQQQQQQQHFIDALDVIH